MKAAWILLAAGLLLVAGASPAAAVDGSNIQWTTRSSAADNDWLAVTYSPQLDLLVAVSDTGTGNRVMTSPDGITWTSRTSAADNDWDGVAWSPELGLFAATATSGTGDRAMTSPDGINWTIQSTPADQTWWDVTWSPELGLFAAVSGSGTDRAMTSPDGENWTLRNIPEASNYGGIAWSPQLGCFAATSFSSLNSRVAYSFDGVTWQTTLIGNQGWKSLAWSPELGLFAAVSSSTTLDVVMTSSDCANWTIQDTPTGNAYEDIAWSPTHELFVAVSVGPEATGRVLTSNDGINWTQREASTANDWTSVTYHSGQQRFVAVALTGTGNRVMTGELPEPSITPITPGGDIVEWRQHIHTATTITDWDGDLIFGTVSRPHNWTLNDTHQFVDIHANLAYTQGLTAASRTFTIEIDEQHLDACDYSINRDSAPSQIDVMMRCPLTSGGQALSIMDQAVGWSFENTGSGTLSYFHANVYLVSQDVVDMNFNIEVNSTGTFNGTLNPASTTMPLEEFWLPILFFLGLMLWSLWEGWRLPAVAAFIGLIGVFMDLPVAFVGALFMYLAFIWLQFYVERKKQVFGARGSP